MTEEAQRLIQEVQANQQQTQQPDVNQPVNQPVTQSNNPTDWARSYFGADPEDVKNFYARRNEIESRIKEVEAKSKISPYASPLTERIDNMIREGHDLSEVSRFIKKQTFDVNKLTPDDLVREYVKEQNPNFTNEDIDAYFEMEFGFDEDDEASLKKRNLRLKSEALKAKKFFEEQKINLDSWTKEQQSKLSEKKMAQQKTQEAWSDVVERLITPSLSKLPVSIESNDFNYSIDIPVSEDIVGQVRNLIAQQNLSGIPLTQDGLKQVQDLAKQLTFIQHKDSIMEAIARDAYAKGRKAAIEETSGRSPLAPARGRGPMVKPGQVPRGFI